VNHADWRTTTDAGEFLAEAGPYLESDPVENTLLLTIAHGALGSAPAPGQVVPLYGWYPPSPPSPASPVSPQATGGAFVHTPGMPIVLGPMTEPVEPAAAALAATLHRQGRLLAGVNGAPAAAEAFAAEWRRTAGPAALTIASRVFQRQRLFRLAEPTPLPPPPGRARVATARDRELLTRWTGAFQHEASGSRVPASPAVVDSRLAYGGLLVWETDGEPMSMAARTPVVGGMSRVAPVYTQPAQRGKGYGGAVTVATSQAARAAGAREVVLFTDLANPTSNALYRRLGFRPVSDRLVLSFTA
jgi:ribosomal protein S18 acetylase RimI-like enzyme